LTSGEVIRKANATPIGKRACTKPRKIGTEEHEQNGVSAPNNAAAG
jgi:hypothetical protein